VARVEVVHSGSRDAYSQACGKVVRDDIAAFVQRPLDLLCAGGELASDRV
jgi:hypothetical protein